MRSADEAVAYLKKLHSIVRFLGISDANMQEGSFPAVMQMSQSVSRGDSSLVRTRGDCQEPKFI